MSDMVEVVIDSIRVSLMSQNRMVILREVGQERYLPIWIGVYEAEAITLALREVEVARPLTWDLLKNMIHILGARVIRVEVVTLREDTYYGNIVIELNERQINIDSRPSDALALAVAPNAMTAASTNAATKTSANISASRVNVTRSWHRSIITHAAAAGPVILKIAIPRLTDIEHPIKKRTEASSRKIPREYPTTPDAVTAKGSLPPHRLQAIPWESPLAE